VVGEIALSVLLVTGAGLFLRSFNRLLAEDPGFPTENLYFARFSLPAAEYSPEGAVVFFDQLLERARGLPMVSRATLVNRPPLLWTDQGGRFHIEGRQAAPSGPLCCMADPVAVGEDFFGTMGVPLIRGRLLEPADHDIDAPPVVVVDQSAATRWWPGEDPVGRRVRAGSEDAPWMTVVGVVENVVFDGPGEVWPHFYIPHNPTARSHPFLTLSTYLTIRAGRDLQALPEEIRGIVREMSPNLAIANTYTMDEIMDQAVARPRFITSVLAFFSVVALILGAVGVYGVVSYGVALRAGEIGIRRALGAERRQVSIMILRQGLVLTLMGLVLGLAGSLAVARVIGGFLHGVSATDPLTYLMVAGGIVLVAFLASYIPARRAGGIDPLDALRME
jgi:putative ABC transport system permease protein